MVSLDVVESGTVAVVVEAVEGAKVVEEVEEDEVQPDRTNATTTTNRRGGLTG